jgi:hypothetical protein
VKAAAVVLWVAAWFCAGFIPAAWFAARDGKTAVARAELATGVIGAGSLAFAGAALW